MKKLNIIHLGVGNVGKVVVAQINESKSILRDKFLVDLNYCGLFTSEKGVFNKNGLSDEMINAFEKKSSKANVDNAISTIPSEFVVIDTTATDKTSELLKKVLKRGGYIVLSNKKPLSSSQEQFDFLEKAAKSKMYFETTVGAGLPIIRSLKSLIATGDEIIEIQGCFSGTLGFLSSSLENGIRYSEAVKMAKEKGYTEPDPRDDLSGLDVARKALIIARLIGLKLELRDISLEKLYPEEMNDMSINEFLNECISLDDQYRAKFTKAKNAHNTLRYIASINREKVSIALVEVPISSNLGNLKGPDNIIVIKTKRYFQQPLVIQGPGAGLEVTAAGVFSDVLSIARVL